MKKHLLLITLLAVAFAGMAQVPGFRGKKFSIKYDLGINHPTLVGRTGTLPMLYHNASIDYVVARAWTIGIKYGFMTYNAPAEKRIFTKYLYSYGGEPAGFSRNDYKGRYTQHTVSFIAKKFFIRKGYLAPVGRYVLLGAYYQYVSDRFVELRSNATSQYPYGSIISVKGKKATAHFGGLSLGLGRNFIVARRMLVDIGFTISLSPYIKVDGSEEQQAVYRDLTLRNLFQLRLGLGFLAF